MITVAEHIKRMQALVEKDPNAANLPIFAVHGASGCISELRSPSVQEVSRHINSEFGCVLEDEGLTISDKFVQISIGN